MPVLVDQLAGLADVELAELGHAEADAHGDAAEDLVVVGEAIHDPAALVAAEKAQQPDFAGAGVDLDLAELGGEGVDRLLFRVGAAIADADHHAETAELLQFRNPDLSTFILARDDDVAGKAQFLDRFV